MDTMPVLAGDLSRTTVASGVFLGLGSFVPEARLENEALAKRFGVTSDWILDRTGIASRSVAVASETTSILATRASMAALEAAEMPAGAIDLLLVATSTPDHPMPGVAHQVQANLGCACAFAFDISAACMGFLVALATAQQFLEMGSHKTALVVGADVMTQITNYSDPSTAILFGDGAGAAVVARSANAVPMRFSMYSDGSGFEDLYIPGGGAAQRNGPAHMVMRGRKVFEAAVRGMARALRAASQEVQVPIEAVDWFVLHQANKRILDAVAKELDVAGDKFVSTLRESGNSGAGSLPAAFDSAVRTKRISRGHIVGMAAAGAGLSWGATIFRY